MVPGYGNAATTGTAAQHAGLRGRAGQHGGGTLVSGPGARRIQRDDVRAVVGDGTWESDGATAGKHATQVRSSWAGSGRGEPLSVLERASQRMGRVLPARSGRKQLPHLHHDGQLHGAGPRSSHHAAPWSEPLLCNLWPYWYSSATFGGGNGCKAAQFVFAPAYGPTIASDPATWFGTNIKGGTIAGAQGWFHDSWFSVEARYLFAFNSAFDLQFFGDDDTFVFINGVLMVDLGGVHQRLPGKVHVEATGAATVQEGGNIYLACTDPTGQTNCPTIPAMYKVGDLGPLRRQRKRRRSRHQGQVQLHLHGRRQDHLRLPGPHSHGSADGPRSGQHLRDRRLQPRRPPHGVQLPAHPLGFLDQHLDLRRDLRRRGPHGRRGVRLRRYDRLHRRVLRGDGQRRHRVRRLHHEVQVRTVLRRRGGPGAARGM